MTPEAAHGGGLDALLASLARTTLVVGKGGVGKTTCAVGLAAILARRGDRTLLLSTDPAAALGAVSGAAIGVEPTLLDAVPGLTARQLSAGALRAAFLKEWRSTLEQIIDRGTYLDTTDIEGLIDSTLPGADEVFAFLELARIIGEQPSHYDRVVVDTAPTGHTLRLLQLPDTFQALLALLEAMQEKHRFMVRVLTRRVPRDAADDFLEHMRRRLELFRSAVGDDASVAALLITRAEPTVLMETQTYAASLAALGMSVSGVIVNAAPSGGASAAAARFENLKTFCLPQVHPPPAGIDEVARLFSSVEGAGSAPGAASPGATVSRRETSGTTVDAAALVRQLTIVGGKGGVGKTTTACALAIAAADLDAGDVLLVSTDPAPSIADVFGEAGAAWATSGQEHRPAHVPRLVLRQLDAAAAFEAMRERYQRRIDGLYDSIVARGVDLSADRRIMRDLLALAPPGIDELYALNVLGDETIGLETGTRRFDRVIVDPAPTGHLLRLLEMPDVALEWTHRLMRLLLKYQAAVGLGDTAADLLTFAKQTRAISALLRDPRRAGMLLVSLNEPVVRAEAERLMHTVAGLGIDIIGVLWNRTSDEVVPLPAAPGITQLVADEAVPGPVGAHALRDWAAGWRRLATES